MPLRRAHGVRRDDVSRREKVEETPPDRSPWTKRRQWTQPGKINNSYWEHRLQSEQSLPPRTPPPRRKILDMMGGRITPQNRENSGKTSPAVQDTVTHSPPYARNVKNNASTQDQEATSNNKE